MVLGRSWRGRGLNGDGGQGWRMGCLWEWVWRMPLRSWFVGMGERGVSGLGGWESCLGMVIFCKVKTDDKRRMDMTYRVSHYWCILHNQQVRWRMPVVSQTSLLYPNANANTLTKDTCRSFGESIANQCLHAVVVRAKASQLDFFCILDLLGVAVAPFDGNFGVCVGIYEDIKRAVAV